MNKHKAGFNKYEDGFDRYIDLRWSEIYDTDITPLYDIAKSEGISNNSEGSLVIAPPIAFLALDIGLWRKINSELNHVINVFEFEEITLDMLPAFANTIELYLNRTISGDFRKDLKKYNIPQFDLARYLQAMLDFVNLSIQKNKNLVIAM